MREFLRFITVDGAEPTFLLARWVFLRLLGLICLAAFVSFWVQARGLIGSGGIVPLGDYLQVVHERVGPVRYWHWPTVFWLNPSDMALHVVETPVTGRVRPGHATAGEPAGRVARHRQLKEV